MKENEGYQDKKKTRAATVHAAAARVRAAFRARAAPQDAVGWSAAFAAVACAATGEEGEKKSNDQ